MSTGIPCWDHMFRNCWVCLPEIQILHCTFRLFWYKSHKKVCTTWLWNYFKVVKHYNYHMLIATLICLRQTKIEWLKSSLFIPLPCCTVSTVVLFMIVADKSTVWWRVNSGQLPALLNSLKKNMIYPFIQFYIGCGVAINTIIYCNRLFPSFGFKIRWIHLIIWIRQMLYR